MRKFLISVSCVLCVLEFTQLFSVEESAPMRNNRPLIYARDRKNNVLKDGAVIAKKTDEDSGDFECQSHLEYEPTAIVNNCVNVITGLYMDFEVDYAIPGAEPFSFQRCYISAPGDEESPLGNGWSRNYFGMIEKYTDEGAKREKQVYVHDSFGSMYHYGRYSDCYKLFRECYKTHVTNCSSGMMSARTNILNNKLKFGKKGKGIFTKCNGEKLTFKKMEYDEFYLTKQLKTTGNKLSYKYNNDYDCDLVKVEAFGKTGQLLGMVEYEYSENNKKTEISLKYGGKQKALYIMDNLKSGYSQYIVAAYRVHAPYISYQYQPKSSECTDPNMIQKGYPDNRFQKIGYYEKGSNVIGNFQFSIKKDSSPWIGRVKCLQAPVGIDETPITTHKFIYNNLKEKPGSAEVYDAYDHLTRYTWDKYKRLSSLARYSGSSNHILTSVDRMYWGGDVTRDEILLSARTFENAAGEIQYMRAFEYDEYGNILYDSLYGNLTGKNQKPCRIFPNGKVIDTGCESYVKHFTYGNDESHLLTASTENDVTQVFAYKKDTDLLISKLHIFKNNIFKREFYDYDENAVLILEMEDDGSSDNRDDLTNVTERHIKRITPQTETPVGLPWIVENKYLDLKTGTECLLNKTVNKYCSDGHLTLKELYDANDKFIGQLILGYDAHGNLIKEVDILGQETIRRYDSNDNKVFEEITGSGVHQEFIYDCSNRLVRVNEVHEDGIVLTQTNTYNILSQKISSTDIYGNSTIYSYDDFGRLTGTMQPPIFYEDWSQASPKNRKEYNLFNTPKLIVDCNGNATSIESNIRGQPTVTFYPDGTTEEIIYNLNGTTSKIIHPNGTYTCFKYDHLKRILDKSIYDSKGIKLQSSTFKYSTFRLKSETDTAGQVKKYIYDSAGRLIEVTKGDGKISYEYDSRGRVYKTIEYGGKGDCLVSIHEFDLVDRIIEERREDIEGNVLTKVSYRYDIAGNRDKVITYADENVLATTITYNSRKLPTKIVDPNQGVTHIDYKYDFYNVFGQAVPFIQTTDSMGNITEEIKDTHGRVAIVTQKNSYGDLLHKTEYFYDLNGNKIRQIDSITSRPNKIAKKLVSETTYGCMNRVETTTEAVGSVDQKRIEYKYNAYGELEEIIKADAVRLKYEYDPLGRMKKYFSSDNTFEYIYTYDSKGNLEKIEDIVNNQETLRTYDKFNRLDKETLGNNLVVQYTYDSANRHRTITFPDKSGVELNYKAHRLMKVHRLSPNKKRLYTHSYLDYDLEDKLLRSKLIGKSGAAEFDYDNLGRPTKLHYNKWNEIISSYDDVGNILKREINDSRGEVTCNYRYDDLYQVIKENGVAAHRYVFDSLHNRIKKDKAKMQVNDLNQILHDSKVGYRYDLNGNLTEMTTIDGKVIFTYDALDRLIEVLSKNQRFCYAYDALNRRLSKRCDIQVSQKKWSTGKKTKFLYVGDNEIGSYDDKGVVQELRLLGLSKSAEIGGAIAIELQGQVYAPLHDHLGNVTALVDTKTAKAVEVYRYSAFGEEQIFDGEGNALKTSINPWRFSSKRTDSETGFVYFGRRYYNPELGRWISPDPIGKSGGPNPYAYVMNKPLTCYDAYGLFGENDESSGWGWSSSSYNWGMLSMRDIGTYITNIGFQCPIPGTRDVMQLWGRTLSGKGYDDFYFTGCGPCISGNLGVPELYPNSLNATIGGNFSFEDDMISRAEVMSERTGGNNSHYFCQASDGVLLDAVKAGIAKNIIALPADRECARIMEPLVRMAGPNGVVNIDCFSRGAVLVKNLEHLLPEGNCLRLDVKNYGGAAYLDPEKYYGVKNYISDNDPVPILSAPIAHIQAKIFPRADVIILKSNTLPYMDHSWNSETYQNAIVPNHAAILEKNIGIK